MFLSKPILSKILTGVFLSVSVWIPWTTATSAVVDEIADDFKPISGMVVMASNGEYIIDVDESNGVIIGDLFSVLTAGKKIIHPKSGKVLGTLEEVKAILKVIRIKPGYSFAQPLAKTADIKRGDIIKRYNNLPALFWDYTGRGKPFFAQLQKTLSDLKWQDYESAQRSRPARPQPIPDNRNTIVFILSERGVEVRDPEFFLLHSYDQPESLQPISAAPSSTAEMQPQPKSVPAQVAVKPIPEESSKIETQPQHTKEAVRFKPQYERAQTIANISGLSVMTDFIKLRNRLLMASTDGKKILIYDVAENLIPVADGAPSYPGQILALKWWQPSNEDPLFLVVTAWADKSVSGDIFRLENRRLYAVKERIPRILGTFDLDGDQRPETLLGQRFEGENFFGDSIRELKLIKDEIEENKPALQLPRRFTVLGSIFADLTGDGKLETAFIRNGILYIYNQKNRLYQSPKEMGGSLSFLTYDVDSNAKNLMPTSASFEVSPVAADIDGDGRLEILAVASEKDIIGNVGAAPGIKKAWLEVVKFQDGRFVKGTLGDEMDTPVQGLVVADKQVLFVATQPGNLFGKGSNSHLLAYTLEP
jgi:hypothetical protein